MKLKRASVFLISALLLCFMAQAQILNPVKWTKSIKMIDETNGEITFTAKISSGWHMYSFDSPSDGPEPLSVKWTTTQGVKLVGSLKPNKSPQTIDDKTFEMKLRQWEGSVTLTQKFTTTAPKYKISGQITFMSCNDQTCTPPSHESFDFSGDVPQKGETVDETAAQEETPLAADSAAVNTNAADTAKTAPDSLTASTSPKGLWAPVAFTDAAASGTENSRGSLWILFWACFLGGLLALLTPCVWPIIPLTVSFFLKKGNSKTKSITSAVTYGLSIIVIYVLLGIIVTAIFGANGLNALATNAVCNIIFFLLLVLFAISFLGAFEIKLPDSWSSKMDSKAEKTTGLLSIFFMAFTLVIVSFSCTGPIIGTLLVETASSGSLVGPILGMFAFALALAIPFTLFALFPSVLKKLPKSGSWLNTVKVVLGFLELALSLKFLSVADLAYGWHILDRETFLALWIAIFFLLGVYLLGMLWLKGDGEKKPIGVVRLMLAIISLAFTAYLLPGLWGAPLRVTSAFVPPLYTQDYTTNPEELKEWDDFEKGMAYAEKTGKPVFLEFSGFGCVNCRKMETAVMDVDEVKRNLQDNFVHIRLMVDDKAELEKPLTVERNGKKVTLTTVGDKWSYLQEVKFNSNSQPYYTVLNSKGELMSGPFVYKEDIPGFLDFLNRGKKKYGEKK